MEIQDGVPLDGLRKELTASQKMSRFQYTLRKIKAASIWPSLSSKNVNLPIIYSAQRYLRTDEPTTVSCKERALWPMTKVSFLGVQKLTVKRFSQSSSANNSHWKVVYEGPLSRAVKRVKLFSLTTAAASAIGCPILVFFGKQTVPLVGKLAIAGVLGIVGITTTLLLHGFTRTYVHRAYFNPDEQKFAVETFSLFARPKRSEFFAQDVIIPEVAKFFSTFEARGSNFFIHEELIESQQILQFIRDFQLQNRDSTKSDQSS